MSKVTNISAQELLDRIQSNIDEGISFVDTEIGLYDSIIPFLKDEHNKVEGIFFANHNIYIIYSKVIPPTELDSTSKIGIFQTLKLYGSSGKYKGVINGEGKSILPNIYYSIEPFMNDILKVECKGHKFGLIRTTGDFILEPVYDRIDSLGELVFAVCKDGKLGFKNLRGEDEIPFIYEVPEEGDEVVFYNGLVCVSKKDDDGKYGYINHKNQVVIPFEYSYNQPFKNGDTVENCKYYRNGYDDLVMEKYILSLDGTVTLIDTSIYEDDSWIKDYKARYAFDENRNNQDNDDWLDAFEGDASNRWNID